MQDHRSAIRILFKRGRPPACVSDAARPRKPLAASLFTPLL